MLPLKDFEFFSPDNVDEAVTLLTKYAGEAKVLAGGTDLIPMMKRKALLPKYVINIKNIPNLRHVKYEDGKLGVGSLTTIREVEVSPIVKENFPMLHQAARSLGSLRIRNLATIGGNICRASPAADMITPLLALDTKLKIFGPDGERTMMLENFLLGPGKTALKVSEILTEIQVSRIPGKQIFLKLQRVACDLAKINMGVVIDVKGSLCKMVRIAVGAVAPTVIRAKETEEFLIGKMLSDEVLEEAGEIIQREINPITDVRSTSGYRREMAKVLLKKAIKMTLEGD